MNVPIVAVSIQDHKKCVKPVGKKTALHHSWLARSAYRKLLPTVVDVVLKSIVSRVTFAVIHTDARQGRVDEHAEGDSHQE